MKPYSNLLIDNHESMAEDLYIILTHVMNSLIQDVVIEEHPENDGEKMFIDLTIKDKIDEETLMSAMITAVSLLNNYDALYE